MDELEAALAADMKRIGAAAEPLRTGLLDAAERINEALRAPVKSPTLEALSARLAYHAEKTRLEQAAWADYMYRKAHPWRARMRSLWRRIH